MAHVRQEKGYITFIHNDRNYFIYSGMLCTRQDTLSLKARIIKGTFKPEEEINMVKEKTIFIEVSKDTMDSEKVYKVYDNS